MHLLGHFTNPPSSLQAVFDALSDEPLKPTAQQLPPDLGMRRLGNGVVQRAVVKVLGAAGAPMRLADIHAAVEQRLGHPVSKESVSWCLRISPCKGKPRFERVAYGYYALADPT